MSHPNLSAGLNALVEAGQSSSITFQLMDAIVGQIVEVCWGGGLNHTSISFRIEKRAGPGWGQDAAQVSVVATNISSEIARSFEEAGFASIVGQKGLIMGACTRNPYAPMGFTMLQMHRITQGRHLIWYMNQGEDKVGWLFVEKVSSIKVISIPN